MSAEELARDLARVATEAVVEVVPAVGGGSREFDVEDAITCALIKRIAERRSMAKAQQNAAVQKDRRWLRRIGGRR
jgi:hypothetical protein